MITSWCSLSKFICSRSVEHRARIQSKLWRQIQKIFFGESRGAAIALGGDTGIYKTEYQNAFSTILLSLESLYLLDPVFFGQLALRVGHNMQRLKSKSGIANQVRGNLFVIIKETFRGRLNTSCSIAFRRSLLLNTWASAASPSVPTFIQMNL